MSVAAPVRRRQPAVVAATLVCAASMLGLGLWAFLDPPSFSGLRRLRSLRPALAAVTARICRRTS